MMKKLLIILVCCNSFMSLALAEKPAIKVDHAWMRKVTQTGHNGAIYLHIHNPGKTDDVLLRAQSNLVATLEMHKTVEVDNVMKMVPIDKIMIPATSEVQFNPKGLHIMLLGVHKPIQPGDTFPLTLTFEKAGSVKVNVTVVK